MKKILLAILIAITPCSLLAGSELTDNMWAKYTPIDYNSVVTVRIYTTIGRHSYELPANTLIKDHDFFMQTHEEIKMAADRSFTVNKITVSVSQYPEYEINCDMTNPYYVEAGKILLIEFSKTKLDVC